MFALIIAFVLTGAATLRTVKIYNRAEKTASAKRIRHLEFVGAGYATAFILCAFVIAGTLESGL